MNASQSLTDIHRELCIAWRQIQVAQDGKWRCCSKCGQSELNCQDLWRCPLGGYCVFTSDDGKRVTEMLELVEKLLELLRPRQEGAS